MKRVIYFVLPLTLLLSMVVLACSEATINQKTTTDKTVFEPQRRLIQKKLQQQLLLQQFRLTLLPLIRMMAVPMVLWLTKL